MDMTVQSDIHRFIKWATAKRGKTLNEKIANNLFLDYSRFFNVVPPGIVIYFQVVEYHSFLKATQL